MKKEKLIDISEKTDALYKAISKRDDNVFVDLGSALAFLEDERHCKILFRQLDFEKFSNDVGEPDLVNSDGFIFKSIKDGTDTYCIGVEEKFSSYFKRFSLAHEIGHLYFNHTETQGFSVSKHICYSYDVNGIDDKENEANAFALLFLMPKSTFNTYFSYFCKEDISTAFNKIARAFRVSEDAVVARVKLLELIGC